LTGKKILVVLVCISTLFLSSLGADIVTLLDGSVLISDVTHYTSLGNITLELVDGATKTFASSEVFSIEKSGKYKVSIANQVDPYIYFVEGVRKLFHNVPPQYIYHGVSYNIDTDWGLNYETSMFFSFLKQQHPDLDERTLSLISNLEKRMIRQNTSMGIAGILIASGTLMTFLPLNLDDIQATPTYGKVIAISGFSLNIVGVGIMIYNAFVNQREYPELIRESFNEYISSTNK